MGINKAWGCPRRTLPNDEHVSEYSVSHTV